MIPAYSNKSIFMNFYLPMRYEKLYMKNNIIDEAGAIVGKWKRGNIIVQMIRWLCYNVKRKQRIVELLINPLNEEITQW